VILFCNRPQCAAEPRAVEALLSAGYPVDSLRSYRGGIHDRMILGPSDRGLQAGRPASARGVATRGLSREVRCGIG
jgi:hypothetical protein